jgi:anaerobic selenocysteine-containing dehydrogenase
VRYPHLYMIGGTGNEETVNSWNGLGSKRGYFPPSDLWYSTASKPVEIHPQHLLTAILEGHPYPIEVIGVMGSNPLLTWSNSHRVHDAFLKVPGSNPGAPTTRREISAGTF